MPVRDGAASGHDCMRAGCANAGVHSAPIVPSATRRVVE
jgi:hypothetical protein